jgi:hypothetical protein
MEENNGGANNLGELSVKQREELRGRSDWVRLAMT